MIDIVVPAEQEGTAAVVRSWLKKIGDAVAEHDPLVELETDKVTQEVPSPAAGILEEILLNSDAEAVPGAVLGRLRDPATADRDGTAAPADPVAVPDVVADGGTEASPPALSPAVRRAVSRHGLDPATLTGSGRGGRITLEDVQRAVGADEVVADGRQHPAPVARTPVAAPVVVPAATPAAKPEPVLGAPGPGAGVRSIPHDRMRRAIAENMLNSVTTAPHVTAVFEADFSAIQAHRRKHKPIFEQDGVNLTITAYLVAACVAAMRAAPTINSRWYDDRVEVFGDIGIGVGTALGEKGLIVPVVQRAQELSLIGIAARLQDLTARARANRLAPADMRGGTFTISNHGVSGSLLAAPIIISQPQSAILGVGKLEKRVVVREVDGVDTIQIRPMCYVSLTVDHRAVDGHQTNGWLTAFVNTLESWSA